MQGTAEKTTKLKATFNVDIPDKNNASTTDIALQVGDVETGGKKKKKKKSRRRANTVISYKDIKLSFCAHVGWDGTLVLLSFLMLAGLAVYLVKEYSSQFNNFDREGLWVYIILAVIYVIVSVYLFVKWKSIALDYTMRATAHKSSLQKVSGLLHFYRETFINGSYYLWKLYLIEFVEGVNQLINLFQVYLCSMPVGFSSGMCFVLGLDSCFRAFEVSQNNTPERRDTQIKVDIFMDTFCMLAPLCVIWFGYKVQISIDDILFVTLFPALCLFSKLRSIYREIIRVRSYKVVEEKQTKVAISFRRHRNSLYNSSEIVKVAQRQQNAIPKNIRKAFAIYSVLYGVFMFVTGVVRPALCSSFAKTKSLH